MSYRYEIDDKKLINIVRQHAELYDVSSPRYNDAQHKDNIWIAISKEMNQPVSTCKFRWSNMRDNLRKVLKRSRQNGKKRKYKYEKELKFVIPFFKAKLDRKVDHNTREDSEEEDDDHIESDQNDMEGEEIVPDQNDTDNEDVKPQISHLEPSRLIFDFINPTACAAATEIQPSDILCTTLSEQNEHQPTSSSRPNEHPPTSLSRPHKLQPTSLKIFSEQNLNEFELKNHQVDTFLAGIASTMKTLNPYFLNQAKSKIFSVVQEFELAQILNNEKQNSSQKSIITEIPGVGYVYSGKDSANL